MGRSSTRLFALAGAIVLLLVVGTTGFVLIEGYPPFDAFYMTLITLTTVGYFEVKPLSQAGRIFNSVLILVGVTTLFLAIGAVAQAMVQFALQEYFEKRRAKKMIDKLSNHYIICGFGRVGRSAAEQFRSAGVPFVVVDHQPQRVEDALRSQMLAVVADATKDETLLDAGVRRARGLVAALRTDADNLFVILSAKTLNPTLNVAARAGDEGSELKLQRAGADVVFAPYVATGHHLAQALLRPHVTHFLEFTTRSVGLDVGIEQVRVAEDAEFVSRSLKDVQLRRDLGVIVLAIRRADGTMTFNPPAEATINGGDYLIVMGEQTNLQKLEKVAAGARA